MFGEDPILGIRRLIEDSRTLPDYERIDDLPEKQRDGLYELQNCAGNAFQLLHDASVASNAHSQMMSYAHALESLKRFCDELETLHGLELITDEHFASIAAQAGTIIDTIKSSDADEDEGF